MEYCGLSGRLYTRLSTNCYETSRLLRCDPSSEEQEMAPVLCYWDIRGLAQPIRLLLAHTGTEYEDRQLSCGPGPKFDKSCWFDNKASHYDGLVSVVGFVICIDAWCKKDW